MCIAPRQHHKQRPASQSRPGQIPSRNEPCENQRQTTNVRTISRVFGLRGPVRADGAPLPLSVLRKPRRKIAIFNRESRYGRRRQRKRKMQERNSRKVSDNHILRISHNVAALPRFALIANASKYGRNGNLPRSMTTTTSGVNIRQIVSLTSNADKIPETQTSEKSSDAAFFARNNIQSAAHSKNPAMDR